MFQYTLETFTESRSTKWAFEPYLGKTKGQFELWRYRDGQVNPVSVVVGRLAGDGVLVTGDVQAGDLVVTSGLSRLSAGLAVDIQLQAGEPER